MRRQDLAHQITMVRTTAELLAAVPVLHKEQGREGTTWLERARLAVGDSKSAVNPRAAVTEVATAEWCSLFTGAPWLPTRLQLE